MGLIESTRSLGDVVENSLGGQRLFALDDLGQRVAGNKLHHQISAARVFAVVIDVGDAFVVNHRGVTRLGSKALEEPRVTHVFLLENLDRDIAQDHLILRLPNLTHTADRDSTD